MKKFNAGEISKLMRGRNDLSDKYYSAAETLVNWIPLPQGPLRFAPGFRYVAGTSDNSAKSRLYPFIYSTSAAYVLEIGNLYIRFFNYSGTSPQQITSGGNPVSVVTPYVTADLFELTFEQKNDTLYIFHPDYKTRKLIRHSDTSWSISVVGFYPPAMDVPQITPLGNLTLSDTTGSITATSSAATFLTGDVGKIIIGTAAAGKALITAVASTTSITCQVLEDFAAVSVTSGNWDLYGISSGQLTPSDTGEPGRSITLTSSGSAEVLSSIGGGGLYWTASGAGTNEFYLSNTHPNFPASKPDAVYENGVASYEGSVGSLGIHQWDWADNDTLGYNTVYVRLTDGADPDSKTAAYVQYGVQSSNWDLFRSNATQGGSDLNNYISINGGLVKITSVDSATVVTCEIIVPLDDATATVSWNLYTAEWTGTDGSATGDGNGYPSCGAFHKGRLWLARNNKIWASYVGEYENFGPGTTDSDAISKILNDVRQIFWLKSSKQLILGTDAGPFRSITPNDAVPTPTNIDFVPTDSPACANIRPIGAQGAVLYLEGLGDSTLSGKKVLELSYQFENDGYIAPDLTILAEHITGSGITDWAYQSTPYKLLWAVRSDGTLLIMAYNRVEQVVAWSRRTTSGTFESVAVIPGPNGQHEVWAIANRTINGSTVRYVECMAPFIDEDSSTFTGNNGLNQIHVDSALTVQNGPASKTVSGLTHLVASSVALQVDAAMHQAKTVSAAGVVTLDYTASVIQAGLSYDADIVPMRVERDERTRDKIKSAVIKVFRTLGLSTGSVDSTGAADNLDEVNFRRGAFVPSSALGLKDWDIPVDIDEPDDEDSVEGYMIVRHSSPLPGFILGIYPNLKGTGGKKA